MNTQVVVRKKAGHDIPRGFLQQVLKNCPSYYGITCRDEVDGNPVLDTVAEAKSVKEDDLLKLLAQVKDLEVFLSFGNMTQDFDTTDDLMPYVFQMRVEGEEEPENILAVHLEGDFPNYNKPGKGHTDEYNLWENFMYPTIEEKFQLANGDIEEFYTKLRQSNFEQAIMNTVSHRAAVVLVPLTGEAIEFGRNDLGGEFEWGTTSNTFGWGSATKLEQAATAAIDTVKKAGGRLSKLMGTTTVSSEPATTTHQTGGTTVVDQKSKDSVFDNWPGTSSKTHTMMKVPSGLQGNARNRWIRLFLGLDSKADLPKSKDHTNFMMPIPNTWLGFAQEDVSTNDDVRNLGVKLKSFQEAGHVSTPHNTKNVQPASTPATAPAAPKKEEPATRPVQDFLPELSADEKKGAVEAVTELATNPKRPTMLEVQRIESKWPVFSEMMGIKFEDMMHWSMADLKALGKKYPNALALAFSEMRLKVHEIGTGVAMNTEHVNDKQPKSDPAKVTAPPASGTPASTGTAPAKKKSRLAQLSGQAA